MRVKYSKIREFGKSDSAGRFLINDNRVGCGSHCFVTSQSLREPSRAYPNGVLRHLRTIKFAKAALQAGIIKPEDLE